MWYQLSISTLQHFFINRFLRLNQMLSYALCLSYHSNTEAVLFACLLSGWATTTGRLLDPKMENSIKCLFGDTLPHRESNQGFATFDYQPGARPTELRLRPHPLSFNDLRLLSRR